MRVFDDLYEAGSEIQRDIFKGPQVKSTRVQQFADIDGLSAHERYTYLYMIRDGGIPFNPPELINIAQKLGLTSFDDPNILAWMNDELHQRLYGEEVNYVYQRPFDKVAAESLHPKLKNTFEGSWPSYRYSERMVGALQNLTAHLLTAPDSRRAFWPIFHPIDAVRAVYPTRVPCSLGYQFMIRRVDDELKLICIYLQRSADFINFWLTDVWFAYRFQHVLAQELRMWSKHHDQYLVDLQPGAFIHFITSFHMFDEGLAEIY